MRYEDMLEGGYVVIGEMWGYAWGRLWCDWWDVRIHLREVMVW